MKAVFYFFQLRLAFKQDVSWAGTQGMQFSKSIKHYKIVVLTKVSTCFLQNLITVSKVSYQQVPFTLLAN